MEFLKRHLTAIIVTIVCLVLIGLAGVAVYRMFYPSNEKSVCGDRGSGPVISDEVMVLIKDGIMDTELVNSFNYHYNLCETTIKFYIDVKDDTVFKDVKDFGDIIVENFSADIIEFYDTSIYVTQKTGEEVEFPAIGQRAKGSKVTIWVTNKEVSDSEE